jgi:hypothetical protein
MNRERTAKERASWYEKEARKNRIMSLGSAAMATTGVILFAEGLPLGALPAIVGGVLAWEYAKDAEESAIEAHDIRSQNELL